MMNAYSIILLATAFVAANSASIRRPSLVQSQEQEQAQIVKLSNTRRKLFRESSCTLFKRCTNYLPTEDHPHGYHEESWVCQLSDEDSERMNGVQFVDVVETKALSKVIANCTSGQSTLTMSEAILDTDSPQMFIPENAIFTIGNADIQAREERGLVAAKYGPSTMGTLNTLVIRVIDSKNREPTLSINKLKNDVFEDSVSLKTQMDACSHGKLKIKPFKGTTPEGKSVSNGIVEIKMDFDIRSGDEGMDQAAFKAAKEQIGDLNDDMFDLVMFCIPPGRDFLAFAYPNSKFSFYNDEWCGYVAAQMHEVGHDLGLAHSGEVDGGEYGDGSGNMGSSAGKDDMKSCYNPQKNYQLGWYSDKVKTINPLDGNSKREFRLNGVVDYDKNENDGALIVLRLKQFSKVQDYYVGYNRAAGMNSETNEDSNRITIVRKETGAPDAYGQSTKVASLGPGESFTIADFNDQKDVEVTFTGLLEGTATVVVADTDYSVEKPYGSCQKYRIEVMTDGYPLDNYWMITDTEGYGRVAAISNKYEVSDKKYSQEVCLPQGPAVKQYKFTIYDNYGDGMCCGQGDGYYKIKNSVGQTIFSGGEDFEYVKDADAGPKVSQHYITIPKDPLSHPPSPAPTFHSTTKPTPTPPCEKHIVEVMTDRYPTDSSWKFIRYDNVMDEFVVATSPKYSTDETLTTTAVCLPQGRTYSFQFTDNYGDGLCCNNGDGYYRVLDKCGNVVIDSAKKKDDFTTKTYTVEVDNLCSSMTAKPVAPSTAKPVASPTAKPVASPTAKPVASLTAKPVASPTAKPVALPTEKPVGPPTNKPVGSPTNKPVSTNKPTSKCKDKKTGKWSIKGPDEGNLRKCKGHAKNGKCDTVTSTGQSVWELCNKSCNRCGS